MRRWRKPPGSRVPYRGGVGRHSTSSRSGWKPPAGLRGRGVVTRCRADWVVRNISRRAVRRSGRRWTGRGGRWWLAAWCARAELDAQGLGWCEMAGERVSDGQSEPNIEELTEGSSTPLGTPPFFSFQGNSIQNYPAAGLQDSAVRGARGRRLASALTVRPGRARGVPPPGRGRVLGVHRVAAVHAAVPGVRDRPADPRRGLIRGNSVRGGRAIGGAARVGPGGRRRRHVGPAVTCAYTGLGVTRPNGSADGDVR